VACPASQYFSTLPYKGKIFERKNLLNIKCDLVFFTNLSEIFIILRIIELDIIKICIGHHVKYPLLLSDFNDTLNFPDRFSKNNQVSLKYVQWKSVVL
jgi:hypothetical protein